MTMRSYTVPEPKAMTDVLKFEVNHHFCRETATLLAGAAGRRDIEIGQVLGRRLFGAPEEAADAGNTGDGGLDDLALRAGAQSGAYRLECIADDGDTVFAVYDPAGARLRDAVVDNAYDNGRLAFTIVQGATPFAVGDGITVTVPEGDGKVREIDFAAVDGTQRAWGVALNRTSAAAGADNVGGVLASVRLAGVILDGLVWPAGATEDQKAAALADLAARFVFARPAY